MLHRVEPSRINGLDTLRATAIALVLMYHYGVVVGGKEFGYLGKIGWIGVDLFFVLSGYLIGNQILQALAQRGEFSLKVFFARRLLRTLPNYYVVLAAYFIFPAVLSGASTASLGRFVTFTQNFGLKYGETFTHSWSLCIEEQFYLILPVICLILTRFRSAVRLGWLVIAAAALAAMAFRGLAWLNDGHNSFSAELYYSSFARFDELLPGVAIAMLKNFHRELFDRILRRGNALLVAGIAATYLILNGFEGKLANSFFMTTFGFSLLAMSFALLLLAALSPTSLLNRVRVPGAASLALWSYAIYMAHKPLFKVAADWLASMNIDTHSPLGISLIMFAGISGGWTLYQLVETPFMRLRARWFPSNRVTEAARTIDGVITGATGGATSN